MTLQDLISRAGHGGDESLVGPEGAQGDMTGLPPYVRSGLIAMAFFGFLSLVSATGLFLYLSYRLLRWHYFFKHQQSRRRSLEALEAHCSGIPDYTLGLPQLNPPIAPGCYLRSQPPSQPQSQARSRSPSPCPSFSDYHNQYQQHLDSTASAVSDGKGKKKHKTGHKRHTSDSSTKTSTTGSSSLSAEVATNPFLLLIYNLLLADIIQAASFMLSVSWLRYDATYSASITCWLQGWLSMSGKLSASACLVFASGLTYMTVVRGYRASPRALYTSIAGVWIFTYVLTGAGVAITHNGRRGGGWFAWSNGWCWVNSSFRQERFWLGYFWIFLSVGLTILIYAAIFATMLRRRKFSWRHMPDLEEDMDRDLQSQGSSRGKKAPPRPSGHHPAFLVYPFIYLLVTGPLATGRMLTMAGYNVSMAFYLFAGALSASHGFLNVSLWSTCILFIGQKEQESLGLDRFMRTPKERTYGNMVWIQGGTGPAVEDGRGGAPGNTEGGMVHRGSWVQRLLGGGGGSGGAQTIWLNQTTARVRPWGAGAGVEYGSQHSLNRQTTGPSERGGGSGEISEMQILTTVTIETSGDSTDPPKSLDF
ncbi:hypothetical protein PG985_011731 [Apiospora marii]|uniref:Glucose receptor Git3 N-terminal domain-containing protein n=1 Tax=Apiospora marii TaxID=335849 RepID=A0ABR1R223_9PEZI